MLTTMRDEELVHAQRLMDAFQAQFGNHIPFIQRQDIKGFLRRKPLWLAKVLTIQQVRKEVELMELEAMRFYQTAAKRTTNVSLRKLLDGLAHAEEVHEDLASKLNKELEESGAKRRGSDISAAIRSSGRSTGSCGTHGWIRLYPRSGLRGCFCHAKQLGCLPGRHGRIHRRWH